MSNGALQTLQKSLQDAHRSLESTNDAIKKLTGRDPAIAPSRSGPTPERRVSGGRMRAWSGDYESPAAKRRDTVGGRSRLAGRLGPVWRAGDRGEERRRERRDSEGEERRDRRDSEGEEQEVEEEQSKPSLQSSVVATTAPPRPNADPNEDGKNKLRNRRMFGFLMGTLQKFKDSEEAAKNSDKEKHRRAIEKKLEETALEEKEVAALERKELFQQRKAQKIRVARIESHLETVAEYEEWNDHARKLLGYIQTRNKPPIFYLPAQHNSDSEEQARKSRAKIEEAINARQKEIELMLSQDTAPIGGVAEEGGGGGGGGRGGGGGDMDTTEGGSVREGGSEGRKRVAKEGRRERGKAASESGEASDSD